MESCDKYVWHISNFRTNKFGISTILEQINLAFQQFLNKWIYMQTGKCTSAVLETSISRHHQGPIREPRETPRTIKAL